MTKDERIKQLATQYRFCANNNQFIHSFPDCKEDIECIAEALEKQIAKEPINKTKSDNGVATRYENCNVVMCPACNGRLKMKSKGKYCDKCGQKLLDWR